MLVSLAALALLLLQATARRTGRDPDAHTHTDGARARPAPHAAGHRARAAPEDGSRRERHGHDDHARPRSRLDACASTPSASPAAGGDAPAGDAPSVSDVRVVSVSNDGFVDPSGLVRVSGTIRNAGDQTVCGVVILVRILDSKGNYLSSAQTPPDVNILPAKETSSFHTYVQAPPGIRGARVNPDRRDVTDGSTTMAGDWKLLGGTEAKVVDATACPR